MNETKSVVQSALSSSVSQSQRTTDKLLTKIHQNETLYGFLDHNIQDIKIPSIFQIILLIEVCIQIVASSFWISTKDNFVNTNSVGYYISAIAFFDLKIESKSLAVVPLVLFSITFLLSIIFLVITYYTFSVTRRLLKVISYAVFFLNEFCGSILLHPIARIIGLCISDLSSSSNLHDNSDYSQLLVILTLVISVISFIYFGIFFYFVNDLRWNSVYLSSVTLMTFDVYSFKEFFILNALFLCLQDIFHTTINIWATYFLLAFYLFLQFFELSRLIYLPFFLKITNILLLSSLTTGIVFNILQIVSFFVDKFPNYFFVIFIICVFIVCFISYYIYQIKFPIKYVVRRLSLERNNSETNLGNTLASNSNKNFSNKTLELLNSDLNSILIESLSKMSNPQKIMFLHYGLEYTCDLFIDFSLIKYIISTTPNAPLLMLCLKIIVWFPYETRTAKMILTIANERRDLTVPQMFLLYEISLILVQRQSSTSSQSIEKLNKMKSISDMCNKEVRSFFKSKLNSCSIVSTSANANINNVNNPNNDISNEHKHKDKNNNNESKSSELNVNNNYQNNKNIKHNQHKKKKNLNRNKSLIVKNNKDTSIGYLLYLSKMVSRCNERWEEALNLYPNSIIFREQFTQFLIESKTDFSEAIIQEHKRNMIDSGYDFTVDKSFILFVQAFPQYLKNKIVDTKGKLIKKRNSNKDGSSSAGTNSNSGSSKMSSGSSTSDMDQKMEEEIGKTIMTQSSIRLALQNAINGKKAKNSFHMFNFSIFMSIFSLILFIIFFFINKDIFNGRTSKMTRSLYCTWSQVYSSLASLYLLLDFGEKSNHIRMDISYFDKYFKDDDPSDEAYMQQNMSFLELAKLYNSIAQQYYSLFIDDFSKYFYTTSERTTSLSLSKILVEDSVNAILCHSGKPSKVFKIGLGNYIAFTISNQRLLLCEKNITKWWNENDFFCSIIGSFVPAGISFSDMRNGMTMDQYYEADDLRKLFKIIAIIVPCIYFILMLAPFTTICILYHIEMKNFSKLLKDFDNNVIHSAIANISKIVNSSDSEKGSEKCSDGIDQNRSSSIQVIILLGAILCILIVVIVIFELQMNQVQDMNTKFQYIAIWSFNSASRSPMITEMLISLYIAIFSSGKFGEPTKYTTYQEQVAAGLANAIKVTAQRNAVLSGSEYAPSIMGFDQIISDLFAKSRCNVETSNLSSHELFVCGSSNMLSMMFVDMYKELAGDVTRFDGYITSGNTMDILHLALNHCIVLMSEIDKEFDLVVARFLKTFSQINLICFVVEMFLSVFLFVLCYILVKTFDSAYEALKLLTRRLSPVAVASIPKLINYLLDVSDEKKNTEMTTSESIIQNSSNAILCINIAGSVEVINSSVTKLLGYSPDQMLGQSIKSILDDASGNEIMNQLTLMLNDMSALSYDSHINCINDSDERIPCYVTLLGIEEEKKVTSFVVIICDESELIKQQIETERAKERSEKLLYEILPRDIVIRLNQGEKDISFTVKSASISFIDIIKFSDYSSTLSPNEIMMNLSLIMGSFDEQIAKYPLLIKIKLIGDVYMSAGGLFCNPDDSPTAHAEQMTRFALDALQQLDEVNIKLNSYLNVRIGINSGGPIIAGVLGTDKPTFDIIGDPINIASRLQSTDIPNRIQISQSTYELIKGFDFEIEPRGEVFLKGKGKTEAYIVSPSTSFQVNSTENVEAS